MIPVPGDGEAIAFAAWEAVVQPPVAFAIGFGAKGSSGALVLRPSCAGSSRSTHRGGQWSVL